MPSKDDGLDKTQPKPDRAEEKKSQPKALGDNVPKPKKANDPVPVSKLDKGESVPVAKAAKDKAPEVTKNTLVSGSKTATPKSTAASSDAPLVKQVKSSDVADAADARNIRSTVIKVVAVVVGLAAVIVIIFGVLIYGYRSSSALVKSVAQIVPYPVMSVNGHFVGYKDYLFEVDANERAYQNNAKLNNQPAVDFKSADGKKLVVQIQQHSMDKLKSDAVTAQLASQKKVKVSDKEVNDLINQLYQRYGGKDTLLKTLNQIYGWNLNDLKSVVYKQLLSKDLQTKVTSDPAVDAASKAKAQDVLNKVKAGGDFTALAKQYSQASDAATGGDLGFFTKGQLPDNVQAAAEALQPGQVSDPIKDQYGYEILKVVEKKDDGSIHALHILIKTVDFTQYFNDQLNKAKVSKYIKV